MDRNLQLRSQTHDKDFLRGYDPSQLSTKAIAKASKRLGSYMP
jgi:hypothetical protein